MILAARVKRFLNKYHMPYRVLSHLRTTSIFDSVSAHNIDVDEAIQSQIFEDSVGYLMVITQINKDVDLEVLNRSLNRDLKRTSLISASKLFCDCEYNAVPPFGDLYKIQVVIDKEILNLKKVYFEPGTHTSIVGMSVDSFRYLQPDAIYLSCSKVKEKSETIKQFVEEIFLPNSYSLPNLPNIAKQILDMVVKSDKTTEELANIIASDPLINQQILCYARAPFGSEYDDDNVSNKKNRQIDSISDAIGTVLDFDTVSHMAVGLFAGRTLHIPEGGPLSSQNIWRHSLYCAAIAHYMVRKHDSLKDLKPSIVYLAGLLHNFGFLLFGHLFPPEFRLLNRWMKLQPKALVEDLEKKLLGMGAAINIIGGGHAKIGAWLMNFWNLPNEIIVVTREHHNRRYGGEHLKYVQLISVVNDALREKGIGDGRLDGPDLRVLEELSITKQELNQAVEKIFKGASMLDGIAVALTN